jgi:hypothetical protein
MKKISTNYWPNSPLYYKKNPDLESSSKIMNYNHVIGDREKGIVFGELQVYGQLLVNGELEVVLGENYSGTIPFELNNTNYDIYGPVVINEITSINGVVTII